jgi:dUTP pyrophosphatase
MSEILIKKIFKDVNLPKYETGGSSGLDLEAYVNADIILTPGERKLIPTGISVAIPDTMEIQIRPRSGLAFKNGISVVNTPGTIDSDYRGEIKVLLINHGKENFIIKKFQRIAQMVVSPIIKVKLKVVEELPETIRGEGGFGSTGQ